MRRMKYAPVFKDGAGKMVVIRTHSVVDVAKRLGIEEGVLRTWVGKFKKLDEPVSNDLKVLQAEVAKLKAELRLATKDRDILKKVPAFIQAHRCESKRTSMCSVLKVHRSRFYACLHESLSPRAKANEMFKVKIRRSYDQSMSIYFSPGIFCELR